MMPTATTTTTISSLDNHSNIQSRSSSSSSSPRFSKQSMASKSGAKKATLRVLYERAKHAFLQRDLLLANELLTQAFLQLGPPLSHGQSTETDPDPLDSQRRKWDILRITLHTTLYTSQSSDSRVTSASAPLAPQFNPASLSPYQFLQGLHSQSLGLFNPANTVPSIGNVPDQVVLLLVVSAVKLGEVHLAKEWVEDWLVRRDVSSISTNTSISVGTTVPTSYERIVDVYILHVLPRLGLWDDATEFMRYESEMSEETKGRMMQALNAQHVQYINGSLISDGRRSRSRSTSPTPSLASSTFSTETIPASATPAPSRPASAASISSSASTATVRPSRAQQTSASFAATGSLMGDRSLSMTSLPTSPLGRGREPPNTGINSIANGNGHSEGSHGNTKLKEGSDSSFDDAYRANGNNQWSAPLPTPPLYQNPKRESNSAQATALSSHMTSVVPFIQSYFLHFYLRLARILNHQFSLDLPVDFDFPIPDRPIITYKPTIWHVVLVFLPAVFLLRRISHRSGTRRGGAGDAARLKLRAQQASRNLILGPYLGIGFWKSAMRAVGDAVSMGGRGLI